VDNTSNTAVELPGETSGELPGIGFDGTGSDGVVFDGIVFDTESGISETEQREILEGIAQAVRREQRSLGESPRSGAKKRGILFPLLVNVAGLVLLGLGLAFFLVFRDSAEIRVQGSAALYNSAERALIREIRRETSLELDAKEREIDSILAKLTGVDGELRELYSSNQELTAEQKITEANLQRLQEEYRGNLSSLQDERSLILESSRVREASLRAQFDERAGELVAQAERSEEALSRIRSELERLSTDQARGATVEAHLSAMYLSAAATINAGRLGEAAATLNAMRDFINTPSFRSIRSVQPRQNFYLSSITTLEELIGLAEKLNTAVEFAGTPDYERAIAQLEERNTVLEEQVESLNQAMTASDAEGSGLGRQVSELQRRIGDLQTRSAEQERTLADQRGTLQEQERSLETQRRTNADLNRQLAELTTRGEGLTRQLADQTSRGDELGRQLTDLTTRNNELGRQLADQTSRNNELTQTVTNLNRTLTERDGELLELSAQNADQTIQIQNLNAQLTTIRQVLQEQ
jgi:chromosome segregation ATPase